MAPAARGDWSSRPLRCQPAGADRRHDAGSAAAHDAGGDRVAHQGIRATADHGARGMEGIDRRVPDRDHRHACVRHRVLCRSGSRWPAWLSSRPICAKRSKKELRGKLDAVAAEAYVRFGDTAAILGGFALASIPTPSLYYAVLRCCRGRAPGTTPSETAAALAPVLGADGVKVAVEIAGHRADREVELPAGDLCWLPRASYDGPSELVDTFQTGDR